MAAQEGTVADFAAQVRAKLAAVEGGKPASTDTVAVGATNGQSVQDRAIQLGFALGENLLNLIVRYTQKLQADMALRAFEVHLGVATAMAGDGSTDWPTVDSDDVDQYTHDIAVAASKLMDQVKDQVR